MRTEVLKYLIEVDKEQSVSKAAHNLYISKSALSESISQLEQELNVSLFNRLKKGVVATDSGRKIINQAKIILSEMDKLYDISYSAPPLVEYNETIKFGLSEKFAKAGLSTCLSIAMQKYPKLILHSALMNYLECIDAINKGKINFAIIAFSDALSADTFKLLESSSIAYIPMARDPIVCLVNKNSQTAHKPVVFEKEFSEHTLITYSNIVPDVVFDNQKVIFLTELDNLFQLVNDNIGISPLPYSLVKNSSVSQWDNIAILPISDSWQYNFIIYSALTPLTTAQSFFIDLYKRIFEQNFVS